MAGNKKYTEEELQTKLAELHDRIQQKRVEAKKLFDEIIHALSADLGVQIPKGLRAEIESIKENLKLNSTVGMSADEEELTSEVALEDILNALESIAGDRSNIIKKSIMMDELKKIVAEKMHKQTVELTQEWQKNVNAHDLLNMLNGSKFAETSQKMGGAEGLLDKAINIAGSFNDIFNKISSIGLDSASSPPPPSLGGGLER